MLASGDSFPAYCLCPCFTCFQANLSVHLPKGAARSGLTKAIFYKAAAPHFWAAYMLDLEATHLDTELSSARVVHTAD